jgi:hypothetical protein
MKRIFGLTAFVTFMLFAMSEPSTIGATIIWGLVIVISLSIAGLTLRQQD